MLKGKVAVVTGGTRGIGYAIAEKYLQNGAQVLICGSREKTVADALEKLQATYGKENVIGAWPNLNNYEEVYQTLQQAVDTFGKIDVMVNNAGISSTTSLENYTEEEFDKIVNLNIKSVYHGAKAAAAFMKETGGVILNTSSGVSKHAQSTGCGYPMSKFAVNGLTVSLARELGKYGIRVNAVAPGITETDMFEAVPEQYKVGLRAQVAMGRFGKPEEVADAFVFLGSDMASFVSGVVLSVDGCWFA